MPTPDFGNTRKLPSGRHQARYRHLGANHTAGRTFRTKNEAIAWLVDERKLIDLGTWAPPAERAAAAAKEAARAQTRDLTVGDWITRWMDLQTHLRASTAQDYRRVITNRITGTPLAAEPLATLTRADVQTWWDDMTTNHPTPPTNRAAYVRLRSALADAVERELLDANPANIKAARRKPKSTPKELPATADLHALVNAAPKRYRFALALCLFHGLRVGEVLALRREHVVRESDRTFVVKVRGNLQRIIVDGRARMEEQPPKTAAGRRDVRVFSKFTSMAAKHLLEYAEPGDQGWLFVSYAGRPLMDTELRKTLEHARVRAGVKAKITPHYGRNWLITFLAENGATPAEIGEVLGQTDLKTITEVYMKARPANLRSVLDRVAENI